MKQKPSSRHAFTLVEIMVAIMVFSLVIAAIYASWMALLRARQVAQSVAAQAQRQRVTLHTLEDALMGIQSFQASPQYYTFILEGGDATTLSFAARVPEYFPRNGKFINPNTDRDFNLRRLTFALEAADGGGRNLVLRQNPVLMDLDEDEQKFPLVLAKNVSKFTVECWGTNTTTGAAGWVDEWLDTNSIPSQIRVNLEIGTTADSSAAPTFAIARVFSIPSQTMPAAVHLGGGANSGNSNNRGNAPSINLNPGGGGVKIKL
jgi:prepilin-type N-terminal cleavage/methylation domain-containing protein